MNKALKLDSKLEDAFKILTELSAVLDREVGTCLCECDDKLYFSNIVTIGEPTRINLLCSCPSSCKTKAVFHTHPRTIPVPSDADVQEAINQGIDIMCVGSTVDDKPVTNCYEVDKSVVKKSA